MKLVRLALIVLVSLVLAACSSAGATFPGAVPSAATAVPSAATAVPSAATSPAESPSPAASASTRIEVALTDSMAIELDTKTFPVGVPVTFVVSNMGSADHEFYLGDEAAQVAHEAEMMANGAMGHDDPEGIAVAPGETKELTYTFTKAGMTLAGCHVAGHYAAGMMTQLTVTD